MFHQANSHEAIPCKFATTSAGFAAVFDNSRRLFSGWMPLAVPLRILVTAPGTFNSLRQLQITTPNDRSDNGSKSGTLVRKNIRPTAPRGFPWLAC
jgi:hypothetical protein